jgi:hypothetical protein
MCKREKFMINFLDDRAFASYTKSLRVESMNFSPGIRSMDSPAAKEIKEAKPSIELIRDPSISKFITPVDKSMVAMDIHFKKAVVSTLNPGFLRE